MDGKKTAAAGPKTAMEKRKDAAKRVKEDLRTVGVVHDEKARVAGQVARINAKMASMARTLDRFSSDIAANGKGLEAYPVLSARIVAARRLIMATRLGLERSMLRYYEANVDDVVRRSVPTEQGAEQ